jgi:AcrR family transcriptional regulator
MKNRILDAEIKTRVLAVAADEFVNSGFSKASLNNILRRCGLSKGRFYYYFADKMDLFLAVMAEYTREIYEKGEINSLSSAGLDFWQLMMGLNESLLGYYKNNPDWFRLPVVFWEMCSLRQDDPALTIFIEQQRARFRPLIEKAKKDGKLRNDLSGDLLIYCTNEVKRSLAIWYLKKNRVFGERELRELLDITLDFLRRMLLPKGSII